MAYAAAEKSKHHTPNWVGYIAWFFKVLYRYSGTKAEREITDEILQLHAKTDEELAAMGLTRDKINHFVVQRFMDV